MATVSQEVADLSADLYVKVTDFAMKQVKLEQVRKDRTLPPESTSDAAIAFRNAERSLSEALAKLVAQQCKELHAAAGTAP